MLAKPASWGLYVTIHNFRLPSTAHTPLELTQNCIVCLFSCLLRHVCLVQEKRHTEYSLILGGNLNVASYEAKLCWLLGFFAYEGLNTGLIPAHTSNFMTGRILRNVVPRVFQSE